MKAGKSGMAGMAALIEDLNSSLGFHIPAAKAQYLEDKCPEGYEALVEAILYIEGLDREDDVRKDLQRKVGDFLLADLRRETSAGEPRETLTLPRKKAAGL